MLRTREFWLIACVVIAGSLVLARVIQFFAMGWRWTITQEQLRSGFTNGQKRKDFWIAFFAWLLILSAIFFFEVRFT
jgi:hypothetical protein